LLAGLKVLSCNFTTCVENLRLNVGFAAYRDMSIRLTATLHRRFIDAMNTTFKHGAQSKLTILRGDKLYKLIEKLAVCQMCLRVRVALLLLLKR